MCIRDRTVTGLMENKQERLTLVRDRFAEADDDQSGNLDEEEAITLVRTLCSEVGLAPPRNEKVKQLLTMCDKNKNGKLELDEFQKFFEVVLRDANKKAKRESMTTVQEKLSKA